MHHPFDRITYGQHYHTRYLVALLLLIAVLCSACGGNQATTHLSIQNDAIVYVALGASDAVGVGTTQPGAQGYVPLIEQHLHRGSHLIDLGISGTHLHEAIQQEVPIALSTHPNLITIWLVANDFIGGVPYASYMHDLDTLLQQLSQGAPQTQIVMANLPDLTLLPALSHSSAQKKAQTRQEIQRWNAQIAASAKKYNVTLVDLFQANSQLTAHPEYISADGFHPSPAGYVQLAAYFWSAIKQKSHT